MEPFVVFEEVRLLMGGRLFLDGVDLQLDEGESLVVVGASGSGKSLLLRLLLGMPGLQSIDDVRVGGRVRAGGQSPLEMDAGALQQWRRQTGTVFRGGGLIENMDVRANIALPLHYHGADILKEEQVDSRCTKVLQALEAEHLDRRGRRPVSLNAEERMFVALARALVVEPCLLLCDDPLQGLDPQAGQRLVAKLFEPQHFADGMVLHPRAHQPTTRLITATYLDPYLEWGGRFAVLEGGRLRELGDADAVLEKGRQWLWQQRVAAPGEER